MPRVHPGPRRSRRKSPRKQSAGVWEGRLRLWIAVDGHNALGIGKVRLLEAIDTTKSLSAAARRLGMSYRLAWHHLRLIEERTGVKVVERRRGGVSGGGTNLTDQGSALVEAYHGFRRDVEERTRSACEHHFAAWIAQR